VTASVAPLLWGTTLSLALSAGACFLFSLLILYVWARAGKATAGNAPE
jgi:hypothetical protein